MQVVAGDRLLVQSGDAWSFVVVVVQVVVWKSFFCLFCKSKEAASFFFLCVKSVILWDRFGFLPPKSLFQLFATRKNDCAYLLCLAAFIFTAGKAFHGIVPPRKIGAPRKNRYCKRCPSKG